MFDKLKSLFVIDDGKSPAGSKKAKKPMKNTGETVKPHGKGNVNEKFSDILLTAMVKNNLEGFDYLEFKQSLQSLDNVEMDMPTKYKSAFAMAKTMGATKGNLIKTANFYIQVLKKENVKFNNAAKNQKQRSIQENLEKEKNLHALVVQKEKEIQILKQEIEKHKKLIDKLKTNIKTSTNRIEKTENDFVASYNVILAQIVEDIENMKKYI